MRKSNGRSMYHHKLGKLNDGDKLKLKIVSYKQTTLFEAVLLVSGNGQYYLQQNKISRYDNYPAEGSGNYGYVWQFSPDDKGNDRNQEVFIDRIIERADQVREVFNSVKPSQQTIAVERPEPVQDYMSNYQTPTHQEPVIIRRRKK